ncbi:MAG: class I SAM-dependent methyltransferase [Candidatus Thorarchaeota archaeon]|jgi:magnesium-protoporphyrin O-methyltransferase
MSIEEHFDQNYVTKELQLYRDKGPEETTQVLIDALLAEGVSDMTLLDIGGGIGAIQHALLRAGVSSCISVEASSAYIEAAKEEAQRQGHVKSIQHQHGNFVDLATDLPQCDIVTLDRVICCYHDVEDLVEKSSALAGKLYGVVYPLNNWWVRILGVVENLIYRVNRSSFRYFVHPTEVVEDIVRRNGFVRRFHREIHKWQIVVFGRKSS